MTSPQEDGFSEDPRSGDGLFGQGIPGTRLLKYGLEGTSMDSGEAHLLASQALCLAGKDTAGKEPGQDHLNEDQVPGISFAWVTHSIKMQDGLLTDCSSQSLSYTVAGPLA